MARVIVGCMIFLFITLSTFACASIPPQTTWSTFNKAKKMARDEVYQGKHTTFYCDCEFSASGKSGGRINASSCGYNPRKNANRGKRLEWEHVVPAWSFGHYLTCWNKGHPECVSSKGKSYKGRKCCGKVNKAFHQAEVDLHNLVPSVGELNGDRSNLPYGIVRGEKRQYGACDFEIGGTPKVTEPHEAVRGDVARIWLYMHATYNMPLSEETLAQYQAWSEQDPIDDWEVERNQRIYALQGNSNPFISNDISLISKVLLEQ